MASLFRISVASVAAIAWLVSAAPAQCTGDCDSGGSVTVDEVVTGVNIALGTRQLDECGAFDTDGSQAVTVDELIQALNFALAGCPAEPTTPPATATPQATATATTPPTGPVITFFGLANASGTEMTPIGQSAEQVPIYRIPSPLGAGFLIVVEAKARTTAFEDILGTSSFRSDPFIPSIRPDLQIRSNRNLGNGSLEVCDLKGTPPNDDPGGGVPAFDPASTDPASQFAANALNDFGCRLNNRLSNDPCTISSLGNPRFLRTDSQAQFCTEPLVAVYWRFPTGDTMLTVRWADASGKLSPEHRLIVRVPS